MDDIDKFASYEKDGLKYVEGTRFAQYDTWLGEIPLDFPDNSPKINYPKLIKNSETGRALAQYAQCKFKTRKCKLLERDIISLRNKSQIKCKVPRNGTFTPCISQNAPCLFDIINDPCEFNNIAGKYPRRTQIMKNQVNLIRQTALLPINQPADPNANPALNGGLWTWWQEKL